ncbi:hypothetical protein PF008_g28970 [Phytophthora fragariae]|uniref:Uncharacterized protein n=1 Tax=Phytophthora fragariae TaxID=53985 RepID=A0A6G0QAK7_9STRA|nr:hypothetical protein PF008_g28970 [Phytophthora fragariae]
MSPCERPSPTQRERAQKRQGSRPRLSQGPLQTPEQQDSSVDLRRESGLESVDQTSGVDLSACAHYDTGETIGKLVTNPLRQLSPRRASRSIRRQAMARSSRSRIA